MTTQLLTVSRPFSTLTYFVRCRENDYSMQTYSHFIQLLVSRAKMTPQEEDGFWSLMRNLVKRVQPHRSFGYDPRPKVDELMEEGAKYQIVREEIDLKDGFKQKVEQWTVTLSACTIKVMYYYMDEGNGAKLTFTFANPAMADEMHTLVRERIIDGGHVLTRHDVEELGAEYAPEFRIHCSDDKYEMFARGAQQFLGDRVTIENEGYTKYVAIIRPLPGEKLVAYRSGSLTCADSGERRHHPDGAFLSVGTISLRLAQHGRYRYQPAMRVEAFVDAKLPIPVPEAEEGGYRTHPDDVDCDRSFWSREDEY